MLCFRWNENGQNWNHFEMTCSAQEPHELLCCDFLWFFFLWFIVCLVVSIGMLDTCCLIHVRLFHEAISCDGRSSLIKSAHRMRFSSFRSGIGMAWKVFSSFLCERSQFSSRCGREKFHTISFICQQLMRITK